MLELDVVWWVRIRENGTLVQVEELLHVSSVSSNFILYVPKVEIVRSFLDSYVPSLYFYDPFLVSFC